MKKMKKLLSLVLSVAMVVAMGVTVFADTPNTCKITAPKTNHQYEIYQIFTGDLANGVLSNIKWGTNGKETAGEAVNKAVLDELTALDSKANDRAKLNVIEKYAKLSNPVATITNGETYTAAAGYYLIKDKDNTVSGTDSYTTYIVEVVGNTTITPKSDVPSFEKKVKDTNDTEGTTSDWQDSADYDIGDEVTFKLEGTVGQKYADYKEYRADAVSKSTDVGAVIPTTVLNQIVEKLESTGMILALVTRTAYKGGVSIPVSTVKPTATWVNEGAGSDKQKKNIAKDGMITFAYHKLRCAVAVSLEVDTMAISAFETLLINNIVEAMTKALEQAIIDGNGTGKPKGILAETPADGQTIESAAPSYSDLIKAEGALPMAYENGAVWCMSKKTFMEYVGMTDKNGQPIAKVNYGTSGKPERTLLGRTVVPCDYVASYSAALTKDTIFAFLFNFKDYVLNTNYSMGVKKYEDNDTDDQITKGIMLVDGKVVDKNSLVVVKKIEAV